MLAIAVTILVIFTPKCLLDTKPSVDFKYDCETKNNLTIKDIVKVYEIDVNTPLKLRWAKVAKGEKEHIIELDNYVSSFAGKYVSKWIHWFAMKATVLIPKNDLKEMQGIAEAIDVNLSSVVMINIFYELYALCTSIMVLEAKTQEIYHARNLDFGLFLGWNFRNHTWKLADILRKTIYDVKWTHNGKHIASTTHFACYIGVTTGFSLTGGFSYTLNQRFTWIPSIFTLIKNIYFNITDSYFAGLLAKDSILAGISYNEAVETFQTKPLLAPCFILIGNATHDGTYMSRSQRTTPQTFTMRKSTPSWYTFITNYDKDKKVLPIDDRRGQCKRCLEKLPATENGTTVADVGNALLNVLSTRPILNKLTTYTTLMNIEKSEYVTFRRHCKDPCPLF